MMPRPSPEMIRLLVDRQRQFRAFLEQRVENATDAEDILQAALLTSVEKGGTVREDERIVAWFYRVLRNAVVEYYRHRGAEGRALARAAGFAPEAEHPEPDVERAVCQCIRDLLPTLREDYAALLRRVDLEGESISAVAAASGETPNNTRVTLHRARRALRRRLELTCRVCAEHGCLDCSCSRAPQLRSDPQHPAGPA